jgi:hypothetical protein
MYMYMVDLYDDARKNELDRIICVVSYTYICGFILILLMYFNANLICFNCYNIIKFTLFYLILLICVISILFLLNSSNNHIIFWHFYINQYL